MRLLLIQGGFGAGGAEKNVAAIAADRARQGDEVHVAGLTMPESGPFFSYPDTVTLHPIINPDTAPGYGAQHKRLLHIRRTIKKVRPDVIVSFLTKVNVLTLIATIGQRVPVVISERNNPRVQGGHPLWYHGQNWLGRHATAITVLTERASEDMPKALQRKAVVIPNGCSPYPVSAASNTEDGINLVAVGRLDRQKGFDLLLQAMAKVHDKVQGAHLTIWGEGPERASLEAQREELGLTDCVTMPGNCPPGTWMSDADMLVFSSRYEGFSNVVAEATVSGLPVVSFDCPYGPREMIRDGDNGILVPLEDMDALAASVISLCHDDALRGQMRLRSKQCREWLDPTRVLQQWSEVIDRAALSANIPVGRKAQLGKAASNSSIL
ncbi:glycosyltransferase family 4 protein [uncultured Roseobacter sp.]|uniref:glycosyltransferase family 4 protein n=1 Tax=uncultured Roseobacter sp. TaxID=114847 RepID=UPI0026396C8D|nr:glycosyltransferase family 4 protein [uncultured Roseobacter sp.]